jgi:hypothetical protein
MTDEELRDLASAWLAPIDDALADLIDKSYRMTAGAFQIEVQKLIDRIPNMYFLLDKRAFELKLEEEMGKAAIKSLEKDL